jgi:arabinofuranan 3-O-arabinosyltransferase
MSGAPEIPALRWFDISAKVIFWIAVLLVLNHLFVTLSPLFDTGAAASALRVDFAILWAAGKLAFVGQPLAAFDQQFLLGAASLAPEVRPDNLLWLYPASFQVLLMPFGALPFTAAFPAFVAVSAIAFALAVRPPASVVPGLWRLMLASPMAVVGGLTIGQTSLLWAAALVAGLWAIQGGRVAFAGLFIALLTMKPQLGLLIPVALIASRQWAVFGWATGFTLLLTGLATAVTGPEYWPLFLDALGNVTNRVADGTMFIDQMSSFYGLLRAVGADHATALTAQLALTAILVAIIAWTWSRRHLGHDLKCATLSAAILLASPYAFQYEMVIELAAALFLIRDGFGRRLAEKTWLLVLWLGPVPVLLLPAQLSYALYMPPVLFITLGICLARMRLSPRNPGPSACQNLS